MKAMNWMDGWLRRLTMVLPDGWSGRRDVMERRYRSAYVGGSAEPLIAAAKARTMRRYLLIALLLVCSLAATATGVSREGLSAIDRDEHGGAVRMVGAEVEAVYGKDRMKRKVVVKVLPKEAEAGVAEKQIAALKKRLPQLILGENTSLNAVVSDLNLPLADGETGIDLTWASDREDLVDERGRVNLIEGTQGDEVKLTARLRKGEAQEDVSMRVILGSPGADYDYGRNLEDSLIKVVKRVNESATEAALSLPGETTSGIRLAWRSPGDYSFAILAFVLVFIGCAVHKSRYSLVDKSVKEWRDEVRRDFPGFLNKLLLLLNAGLVITSAIAKIADDYEHRRREGEEQRFYEELIDMNRRMRASNTTLVSEFTDMAARSGHREIMRFSTILADNIDRGNALAEKLSQESLILWKFRKKNAEERGRLAETKLTFPMALQLLAILLITVAPAVMNMR
ncbi:MAG: type II secretion system F family protein [Clostridiales Family XIII bacterium]|jgi:hypothetical protein|nr:type II secretion system F family protein [Clostridiales Family XIII bacterium]